MAETGEKLKNSSQTVESGSMELGHLSQEMRGDSRTNLQDAYVGRKSVHRLLRSGEELMHLKRNHPSTEVLKLPRFGAKLDSTAGNRVRMDQRLEKIYKSKKKAFHEPRYKEVSLDMSGQNCAKDHGKTGILSLADMTVRVEKFRGSFSQLFGITRFDSSTKSHYAILSPFEAFFLADMGALEICISELSGHLTLLGIEDVRALFERHVPAFVDRYCIFSEIHRTTQLSLRSYGDKKWSKNPTAGSELKKYAVKQSSCDDVDIRDDREAVHECSPECGHTRLSDIDACSEIPPLFAQYDWKTKNISSPNVEEFTGVTDVPSSFDMAFTAFRKTDGGGPGESVFDVALTVYHIPVSLTDLFAAVKSRPDSELPLYIVRDDVGSLNGFAALEADIPFVIYETMESAADSVSCVKIRK